MDRTKKESRKDAFNSINSEYVSKLMRKHPDKVPEIGRAHV